MRPILTALFLAGAASAAAQALSPAPTPAPLERLKSSIERTGDFLPYIGNDVGVLEAPGRTVILSVFTANHFGSGEALEESIGRVAEQVGAYFAYRN